MRALFDINHPAHVHYLRHVVGALRERGHACFVTARDKDVTLRLLEHYDIPYAVPAPLRRGTLGRMRELVEREWGVLKVARRFRPGLIMGTSPHAARVARLIGARSIVMSEDDLAVVPLFARVSYPLASLVVTPDCLAHERHGARHRTYPAYQKLLYLHPSRFQPDPGVLEEIGVGPDEPFGVVRLSALDSHHDTDVRGVTAAFLDRLIQLTRSRFRLFASAEASLAPSVTPFALHVPPHRVHDVLAHAAFFVGDSQSMTVEAAVLGTPAFQISSLYGRLSVPLDLARFGLCFGFRPGEEEALLQKLTDVLRMPDRRQEFQLRRQRMLAAKIDPLPWFLRTIGEVVGEPV